MESTFIESEYPINFREEDAKVLGEHLRLRHSVELIGAKRVGISNFLRFFLYHKDVVQQYINHGEKHLFIAVDLNDLVEREIFPFWILTFKRLADTVDKSALSDTTKRDIAELFLNAIQSRDLFMTIENLRDALAIIVKQDIYPTIFFIRFDRIKDALTPEFFNNLQGLKEATAQKLSYVFTSFRSLDILAPKVFSRQLLSVFSHLMYVKPAETPDMKIIFDTFEKQYNLSPSGKMLQKLVDLSGGHVQYLQLALIILSQKSRLKEEKTSEDVSDKELFDLLFQDERINLQSEEIWESLSQNEQEILQKIFSHEDVTADEKEEGKYLFETGLVRENGKSVIFSPLFAKFLEQKHNKKSREDVTDFTKKENMLFTHLQEHLGDVCEREKIIEAVWPEYQEYGVSDWTIDRLVARLRTKLRKQESKYSIVTVKTRGYKLIEG